MSITMRAMLFDLPFGIPLYAYGLMLTVSVIAAASALVYTLRRRCVAFSDPAPIV